MQKANGNDKQNVAQFANNGSRPSLAFPYVQKAEKWNSNYTQRHFHGMQAPANQSIYILLGNATLVPARKQNPAAVMEKQSEKGRRRMQMPLYKQRQLEPTVYYEFANGGRPMRAQHTAA